jgi:hypothetical protein
VAADLQCLLSSTHLRKTFDRCTYASRISR